jgi:uncharacterized alkaline shock family protein YloU
MNIFVNLYHHIVWLLRGVQVFTLVGRSGSGKSFRARLLTEKYRIELIIDDGLLIRDQRIIAGTSAKKEKAYLTAIKTALFTAEDHRKEMIHRLKHEKFKRVLILGTSDGMVSRICKQLDLPQPFRTIKIEEIATEEEIRLAMKARKTEGKHIIPVPAIEVKQNYPHMIYETIKIFFENRFFRKRRQNVFEKTVVRPEFNKRGRLEISEAALGQMVLHCVSEYDSELKIERVQVKKEIDGYSLVLHLRVPYGKQLSHSIPELQKYVCSNIESYSGVSLRKVDILIAKIGKPGDA